MRLIALAMQILVPALTLAIAAWVPARGAMRLLVRTGEQRWPLRKGSLAACTVLLAAFFLLIALVVLLLGWLLSGVIGALWPEALSGPWARVAGWVCLGVFCGSGMLAAALAGLAAREACRQRLALTDTAPPVDAGAVAPLPAGAAPRRIVIFCDGTANRADDGGAGARTITNVRKLFEAMPADETQVTWYQAGVGSDSSSSADEAQRAQRLLSLAGATLGGQLAAAWRRLLKAIEAATGAGISEGIVRGYAEIVRQYRPGDQICLVGFSRGAFTARCIAGVIYRCGLLRAEHLGSAEQVVSRYRMRHPDEDFVTLRADMVHPGVTIDVLALFDTVASLGAPLWGWWFRILPMWKLRALTSTPLPICRHVYNAMAMDERRSTFFAMPFAPDERIAGVALEQRWFRGAHADIGGGYAECGLSDIALDWMMAAMARHGLRFRADAQAGLAPNPLARMHDELSRRPAWRLFGSWPRWHPVPGSGEDAASAGGALHPSVLTRRAALLRMGRPDMLCLAPGEGLEIAVEAARDWDRTGVVIEAGAAYRLTYLGGWWRSGARPPCRADGEPGRQRALRVRRLPEAASLCLIGTIAHPRAWPVREEGLGAYLGYLFNHDPVALKRQLAPLGRTLRAPGDRLVIANDAASGLLHLFANESWQTASPNSGAIRLRVERLPAAAPGAGEALWRLDATGGWRVDASDSG